MSCNAAFRNSIAQGDDARLCFASSSSTSAFLTRNFNARLLDSSVSLRKSVCETCDVWGIERPIYGLAILHGERIANPTTSLVARFDRKFYVSKPRHARAYFFRYLSSVSEAMSADACDFIA